MSESLSLMGGPIEAEDDFNLTVVRTEDLVLMGKKKQGFGAGKLVLPGGKSRYYTDESGIALIPFAQEAAREVTEESSISLEAESLV